MSDTSPPTSLARFGLAMGHATDVVGATGLTVVRGVDAPFRAAAHVLGRGTGSRELGPLDPAHLVDRVDAVLLTGGSAYGLEATAGVMRWMEEHGRGFPVGGGIVPIVPAAVIFDLAPLGRFDRRPTPAMAYAACDAASVGAVAEGSVGAGTGATVGKVLGPAQAMKGGVGCAVLDLGDVAAMALAVVNALGDVRDGAGRIIAGARAPGGGWVDAQRVLLEGASERYADAAGGNTTLAVVAVDRPLPRVLLRQLAAAASGALHRRITPVGTSFDGDIVFALSPHGAAGAVAHGALLRLEALVQAALEDAVERAVRAAVGRDGVPGLADAAPAG